MGIYYSACVVCGFKLDIEFVEVEKTRYDPDTGKPHAVKEHSHCIATIDGKLVIDERTNPDAIFDGLDGLSVKTSGYSGVDDSDSYLCHVTAGVSDESCVKKINFVIPAAVKVFARKHGVVPGWFLIMSCG